jgi:glycosyltransferase involved in cell wall biosynthesis
VDPQPPPAPALAAGAASAAGATRILLVNTLYPPNVMGGAEISVRMIAEAMAARGFAVAVLSVHKDAQERRETRNGVDLFFLPHGNVYWPYDKRRWWHKLGKLAWHALNLHNPRLHRRIGAVVRAFKPDVVHVNVTTMVGMSAWWWARRLRLPVIQTLHDYNLLCTNGSMMKHGKPCARSCTACRPFSALKRSCTTDTVTVAVGVSRFTLDRHCAAGFFANAERIVIGNQVSPVAELPRPAPAAGNVRFGFLGRLEPAKGIDRLLAAWATMSPRPRLLIAGTGTPEYTAELQEKYRDPALTFLGWTAAGPFLAEQIDCLVVPSVFNEPFGRVVIEAYVHGVPVLGSNRGGMEELVVEGETGMHLDPDGDIAAVLRTAMARLADPVCFARWSANARAFARRYDADLIEGTYAALYARIAAAGRDARRAGAAPDAEPGARPADKVPA